jgi:hypothetical protein
MMSCWSSPLYRVQTLEDIAADKGESGLVISLSKPFQRLLKYPLLFQNLLYVSERVSVCHGSITSE